MKDFINDLAKDVRDAAKDKGFWDDYEVLKAELGSVFYEDEPQFKHLTVSEQLAKIALMHSELSEAAEAVRKNAKDDKLPHRSGLEVELADAVIRILDFSGYFELDLGGAIEEKLAYNKSRAYKHGKAI